MQNIEELIISREDSYIFFQVRCIPVHPSVVNEYKENKSLNYELMNEALDDALDWTYRDLKEHPELIPEGEFLSPLQTIDGKETTDIEVIQSWLKQGSHSYYQQKNEMIYHGDDVERFPFSGLRLVDSGIYIGSKPIIITYDRALVFKKTLEYFNKAIELNPFYRDAWFNKALALRILGRYEEARKCLIIGMSIERYSNNKNNKKSEDNGK